MTTPEVRYRRWQQYALTVWTLIGVLILVAAALAGLRWIAAALVPFVIAFLIVFLLNWPVRALAARGMTRGAAAIVCLVVGFALFGAVMTLIGPFVGRQVLSFGEAAPGYLERLQTLAETVQQRYAAITFPAWLSEFLSAAGERLSQLALAFGNSVARMLVSAGGGVLTAFIDIALAVVIAFWALKDLPKLREELLSIPGPKYHDDVEHLLSTVTRVVGGYLKGQTVASLCTGTLAGIGLAILGVPYALVIGIITVFLNYVPYVGPFVGGLIAGLVGLTQGPWIAVFAVGVVILAQNLTDNLVTPRVMSEQVDLHPTLVIFSLLVGGSLFGVVGMLFAIPVAATAKGLFVYYYEQRTQRQLASENGALFKGPGCDPDQSDEEPCEDAGTPGAG